MNDVQREMPTYLCHKVVHALKIERFSIAVSGATMLHPVEEGFAPFKVDDEYIERHHPRPGGYYVVYEDGYKSFSPQEVFESGYTLT